MSGLGPEGLNGPSDDETARALLGGNYRLSALNAFSTEDHLQREREKITLDPNTLIQRDRRGIAGGHGVIRARRELIEQHLLAQDAPDMAVRASSLENFFRLGFGIVERSITGGFTVEQADVSETTQQYQEWIQQPQEARMAEMRAYLRTHDAELLSTNFLEPEVPGTLIHFATTATTTTMRVTGEEPFHLSGTEDPVARGEAIEGTLAALFLLREHQVAQEMHDMLQLYEPAAPDQADPPPDYID